MADPEFETRIRRALDSPLGGPLGRIIPVAAAIAVIVDGGAVDAVSRAMAPLLDALRGAGQRAARSWIVLAAPRGSERDLPQSAAHLRSATGLPAIPHDPDRSPCFRVGKGTDGSVIELSDELREAEAIITVGPVLLAPGFGLGVGAHLLFPGLAAKASLDRGHEGLPPIDQSVSERRPPGIARHGLSQRALDVSTLIRPDLTLCWIGPRADVFAGLPEAVESAVRRWLDGRSSPVDDLATP